LRSHLDRREESRVSKIDAAIREAVVRGARREVREQVTRLRREVRRLRHGFGELRRDAAALKNTAALWQRMVRSTAPSPELSERELRAARLSPGLIRKLRARLGVSQAALARLAGVSPATVVGWERGRSRPTDANRRRLIGLRKLGRREARRLLAAMPSTRSAEPRRRARRRAASRRRR
jgi:DNA-binding transcriptional regulator YiaG